MEHTKTVGGKDVPLWSREEVDEIVIAQVNLVYGKRAFYVGSSNIYFAVGVVFVGRLRHNCHYANQHDILAVPKPRSARQVVRRNHEKTRGFCN